MPYFLYYISPVLLISVLLISINSDPNVIKRKQWYVNLNRITFHKKTHQLNDDKKQIFQYAKSDENFENNSWRVFLCTKNMSVCPKLSNNQDNS